MNLKAKISGPLDGEADFFLAKGKFGNDDWTGVIQRKGEKALLITHRKQESKLGNQKVVSYSGGAILAECKDFSAGKTVEFKEGKGSEIRMVLRAPRKLNNDDLEQRTKEQEAVIKKQTEMQNETNELLKSMMGEFQTLKERVAQYEAKEASEEESPESPNEETAGTTKPGTKKKS